MRVAIVSDIHGNLTAFQAVLQDLRKTTPDLILQGGDLTDSGAHPTEILDQIRDLNWPGVHGNTDEALFRPESLTAFATQRPQLKSMFDKIEEMAAWTRDQLGPARLAWLEALPIGYTGNGIALTHATPESTWRTLNQDSDHFERVYAPLSQPLVVYGHIHRPFVKQLNTFTIANSGSVGQPHDGDHRASYLLIDEGKPTIRRVEYDLEKELKALKGSGLPYSYWIAKILETAHPQMP